MAACVLLCQARFTLGGMLPDKRPLDTGDGLSREPGMEHTGQLVKHMPEEFPCLVQTTKRRRRHLNVPINPWLPAVSRHHLSWHAGPPPHPS